MNYHSKKYFLRNEVASKKGSHPKYSSGLLILMQITNMLITVMHITQGERDRERQRRRQRQTERQKREKERD